MSGSSFFKGVMVLMVILTLMVVGNLVLGLGLGLIGLFFSLVTGLIGLVFSKGGLIVLALMCAYYWGTHSRSSYRIH